MLNLSEDAYQGDAQISVAVVGKSLGAVQSVVASHGNGTQHFSIVVAAHA